MIQEHLSDILEQSALAGVNPAITLAFIKQESAGNTYAARYEPHYRWLLDPELYAQINQITMQTEVVHQKTSWGLCQIMGGVARELGFTGPLTKLTDPNTGLYWSLKKIIQLHEKYPSLPDLISAYNQGSPRLSSMGFYKNQNYVDKVHEEYRKLKAQGGIYDRSDFMD